MGDTRVVITDTGSLTLNILGLTGFKIDGNDISIPEKGAKITDIEITPDVKDKLWRFSTGTISWKAFAPAFSDAIVKAVAIESAIGGIISMGVEGDGLLHIHWEPPSPGLTFANWFHPRSGFLRSPANLQSARIDRIRVQNDAQLIFEPQPGTHSRLEVVSFGPLFHFEDEPESNVVVNEPPLKKTAVKP